MGADGEEGRIEAAGLHALDDAIDLAVELDDDAEIDDAADLGIEHVARQAVFGNAEPHHAAGERAGLVKLHCMTHAP